MEYQIVEYNKNYEEQLIKLLINVCVKEIGMTEYEEGLKNYVINNEFIKIWLIKYNEQIIATIGYCERNNKIAEVKKLYIDQEHRNKGLGRKLMDVVVEHIKKEKDYDKIYVGTSNHFKNAIKFYQKYGFEYVFDEGNGYIFELKIK